MDYNPFLIKRKEVRRVSSNPFSPIISTGLIPIIKTNIKFIEEGIDAKFSLLDATVNVNIKDTKNAHILDTTFDPNLCPFSIWFSGSQCASLGLPV